MIDPTFLERLRCPLDHSSRLEVADDRLVCQRCSLKFRTKDGFPNLVAEEAELPPGCPDLRDLPCQRAGEAR